MQTVQINLALKDVTDHFTVKKLFMFSSTPLTHHPCTKLLPPMLDFTIDLFTAHSLFVRHSIEMVNQ